MLSLSTWRDEKALIRWRTQATHHTQGQERGRFEIFADYHLRVGEVNGRLGRRLHDRLQASASTRPRSARPRAVTLTELAGAGDGSQGVFTRRPARRGSSIWNGSTA